MDWTSTNDLLEKALRDAFEEGYKRGVTDTQATISQKLAEILGGDEGDEPSILEMDIDELKLSGRPSNYLGRYWVFRKRNRPELKLSDQMLVRDLVAMAPEDLLAIPNFGQKSVDEVVEKLAKYGLELQPNTRTK